MLRICTQLYLAVLTKGMKTGRMETLLLLEIKSQFFCLNFVKPDVLI